MALPDHRVLAVRVGTRETERSDVYLNYRLYGEVDGPATVDYYFWIIQGPDSTVVVDTGFSEQAGRKRGRTLLLHPSEALRQLGIDPDSVEDVIVTHGHYDHIGNLGLFPRARIHMTASEYAFWTSPTALHTQFSYYSEPDEIDVLRRAESEGRLLLFSGSLDLAPGIRVEEVGGHTPGQAVVRVSTEGAPVLLASDAVHFYEELERDMPFTAVSDLPAMYAAFEAIRNEASGNALTVVPGHDADVLTRFPQCPQLPEGRGVDITGHPALQEEGS
ncbi:N-acyl homoserine lactonase family protein [Streptomyces sp. NPDC056390]|uniref:N-acyl homoserine lactonase family protein n=1 Tax=Streptomyces sp. NPDC056390 TaxID=3345806 RepID=UPI0035DE9C58